MQRLAHKPLISFTLLFYSLVVPALLSGCRPYTPPEGPNILILMAEDMSPRVGAFGDPVAVTPAIDLLASDSPKQVFKCELRLAVGPSMQGKKIAILYTLRGPDKQSLGKGRLKIKFGKVTA